MMRSRRRKGSRTVVVHYLEKGSGLGGKVNDVASTRSARFGLVVGKNVGNAVTRHRVSRLLREAIRSMADELDAGCDVVVRALPPAAGASGKELEADVRKCLRRLAGAQR